MMVEHLLTSPAIRLTRSATLQDAAILMRDCHVGAVLVTEEGVGDRLIGIVTDRDLVIHAAAEGRSPKSCTVGDVMTPTVVTVPRHARVSEALDTMHKQGVRRLAVVNENGGLAGFISLDDILEAVSVEFAAVGGVLQSGLKRELVNTGATVSPETVSGR